MVTDIIKDYFTCLGRGMMLIVVFILTLPLTAFAILFAGITGPFALLGKAFESKKDGKNGN